MIEGPPPLNRIPSGLLGFFGIKNGGRNPQFLTEPLAGQVDLLEWYLNSAPRFATTTTAVNAGQSTITVQPPNNEAWYVTDYGVWVDTDAAELGDLFILRFDFTNTITIPVTPSVRCAASSTTVQALRGPIWLMPGEKLGFGLWNVTGTLDVYTFVRYVILPV